jgi:hypothetical protein
MKKTILLLSILPAAAFADFKKEVESGLARASNPRPETSAFGSLGRDVYNNHDNSIKDYKLFIPTDMYVRLGGGANVPFASGRALTAEGRREISGGWNTLIGLGFDMSSYVRLELDYQGSTFGFSKSPDLSAHMEEIGGMIYFDFARRYVMNGDITTRRTFIPFMGLGLGAGGYKFDEADGIGGKFIAPRAALGATIMFSDLLGLDIMYQQKLMINDGFGWGEKHSEFTTLGNITASIKYSF